MPQNSNRRRILIIDKLVQNRIVFGLTWPPVVCLVLAGGCLAFYAHYASKQALIAGVEVPGLIVAFLLSACFVTLAGICLLLNALIGSHRMAGPMYRLQKTIKCFQQGDREIRAFLRKRDYLHELARDLNAFLDWVEQELPAGASPPSDENPSAVHRPELLDSDDTEDVTPQTADADEPDAVVEAADGEEK